MMVDQLMKILSNKDNDGRFARTNLTSVLMEKVSGHTISINCSFDAVRNYHHRDIGVLLVMHCTVITLLSPIKRYQRGPFNWFLR